MDIWASRRGWHREARAGQQQLPASIALSHSCSFISALTLCDSIALAHLFPVSSSSWSAVPPRGAEFNLHTRLFLISAKPQKVVGGLQGWVRGGEGIKVFFISVVVRNASRWISHKQLKVIWTLKCVVFFCFFLAQQRGMFSTQDASGCCSCG